FVAAGLRSGHGAFTGWVKCAGRTTFARAGGWFEVFEESVLDLDAWIAHSSSSLGAPVVLAGHSLGALRAAYYAAQSTESVLHGLVLGSFSYGLRTLDAGIATQAEAMVAEGRGAELLPVGAWPRGFGTTTVSAQTYASWWRVAPGFFGEPATTLGAVRCPTFVWYGTKGDVGGPADLEWLAGRLAGASSVDSAMLDGVSHGYDGGEETIATAICDRLTNLAGEVRANQ